MTGQKNWDYLIVTASSDAQASAYKAQLNLRRQHSELGGVGELLVVADPEARRVGSGGSTIFCLMQVVNKELATAPVLQFDLSAIETILRRLRILIIHAGGDSRRLPAYGPCGKIFIPVPGKNQSGLGVTLFDRLIPQFLNLPPGRDGHGQVVIAAGDALILFDASNVSLAYPGLTALTCSATPEHASKHGVFCPDKQDRVRLYLQKPNLDQQQKYGALNAQGKALLDIAIMSFDSSIALALFKAFGVAVHRNGNLEWDPEMKAKVLSLGVDFYREICCAFGTQATAEHHVTQARAAGSAWPDSDLNIIFQSLSGMPFSLQAVPECRFLHFGTTRQLISSGNELYDYDLLTPAVNGAPPSSSVATNKCLSINNKMLPGGQILGTTCWVEGCEVSAPLQLAGENVVVGVNINKTLSLPAGACLDMLEGTSHNGEPVWFVRCYGVGTRSRTTS